MTTLFFGELLLRLSAPGRQLLLQSPALDVCAGGAEANVAVGLACLGHAVRMASAVPDNALGRAVTGELRRHGVDTCGVRTLPGRLGLYFLNPGAGLRASEVVYDREGSAFALAPADGWDWDALLAGVTRLHLSGITPALGPNTAAAAVAAARAARERGVPVSFDGNYRARLWEAWDSDPREILTRLVGEADILFGNHRDVSLLLGREFSGDGPERRREAAEAAFDAFPRLQVIASTARHVDDADSHRLAARVDARGGWHQTDEVLIAGIVDRIGAGDAFAAGVLHGIAHGIEAAAESGLALAALKHSLPGDMSLFRQADIDAFLAGGRDVRR
ncbi:sugar kinase [Sphingomonas canadensis]|uniref:Sugar kinase n=1 Tax=Sphingomonas canadensis TaxID=1219257 RepID=A0ABW3HC43_9SPHN|nr:sugar kinase [Sphingomonas canadensis]MCW3837672.1 sugar kinase [Sphingomonas canadensis]